MVRTELLDPAGTSLMDLAVAVKSGRVAVFPWGLTKKVYVIHNRHPEEVMVTDISIKGVQLNGAWSTWEELEQNGGVYESEFAALNSIASPEANAH